MKLKKLLDYELRSSVRYRRFISVVMIKGISNGDDIPLNLKKLLEELVRTSDEAFLIKDDLAVLMGETDLNGSLEAVKRYKKKGNGFDMRFAVAAYPNDGHSTEIFLETLLRRLEKAKKGKHGTVVTSG